MHGYGAADFQMDNGRYYVCECNGRLVSEIGNRNLLRRAVLNITEWAKVYTSPWPIVLST
jgi:hypothetical protein